jgi:putative heme-binding domain-containing protein
LKELIKESTGQPALECLWALNLSGGLDGATAPLLLYHADPYVRLWTIRLLADNNQVPEAITAQLIKLAREEEDVEVRSQLACSIKRLPARDLLPVWRQLVTHDEDVNDPHLPLLLWWALESKCDSDRDLVLGQMEDSSLWHVPLVERFILSRLMRRFAQPGTQKDLLACARLLRLAPRQQEAQRLLEGFEQAFTGRPLVNLPRELIEALAARGGGSLALRVRQGKTDALDEALKLAGDGKADKKQRLQLIPILGEVREPRAVPVLLTVLDGGDETIRQAAVNALLSFGDPGIGAEVIRRYNSFSADTRTSAQTLLASRAAWSVQLLEAIDAGRIKADTISEAGVRRMLLHKNSRLAVLVKKHYGEVKGATTAQMRKQIDDLGTLIRKGPAGNPYAGKKLFTDSCGKCHTLFGKGGAVGPDLTSYKRDDLDTLLLHVVNPSAEIREGYENYLVVTGDGRSLNGFLAEKDDKIVVLRGTEGQSIVIERNKIDEMRVIPVSLMPEGLLKDMNEQQMRDLFAYLRCSQPLPE